MAPYDNRLDGSEISLNKDMRKLRKPVIEKMRRDRINSSIDQLRMLLEKDLQKNQLPSKPEKADILEMAVSLLRQQIQRTTKILITTRCIYPYNSIYNHLEVQSSLRMQLEPDEGRANLPTLKRESSALVVNKIRKPVIEKMRRDRINSSIEKLRILLEKDIQIHHPHSKLEKADILEMAVTYLQQHRLQQTNDQQYCMTNDQDSYYQGYYLCLKETMGFLHKQNPELGNGCSVSRYPFTVTHHTCLLKLCVVVVRIHPLSSPAPINLHSPAMQPICLILLNPVAFTQSHNMLHSPIQSHTTTHLFTFTQLHTLSHTATHLITFTQPHTLSHTATHLITFTQPHTLSHAATHLFTFTQPHTLQHTATHLITFTQPHTLSHTATHLFTFTQLHTLSHTATHLITFTQPHTLSHTATHLFTFTQLHTLSHTATHLITFIQPHTLSHTATNLITFTQPHTLSHRATHLFTFTKLHTLSHTATHLITFTQPHTLSHRATHLITFTQPHTLSHRATHLITFAQPHTLSHTATHLITFAQPHTLSHTATHLITFTQPHIRSHIATHLITFIQPHALSHTATA
ncbi:transcription factor HES-5-like [Pelobates cultripes]|uniref:Transcription factor HES-5 n=1 Tax=Pelobates cultripes TaxID=61616 RepID=A0AAD1T6N0_PELCU|nr:transcription factor HES-5-like [Pelobates cultripes]